MTHYCSLCHHEFLGQDYLSSRGYDLSHRSGHPDHDVTKLFKKTGRGK